MPRGSRVELKEEQKVRFVSTSLLDEIGVVREAHSDGTSLIEIVEGTHAGGGGLYSNAEFVAVEKNRKTQPVEVEGGE